MAVLFYRLSNGYALRGWLGMSGGLVKDGHVRQLREVEFRVLALCDGRTELDKGWLSEQEREAMDAFLEQGVVSTSEIADPIVPEQEYRRYNNRYVETLFWSITGRCNYRCRHCYMDAPDGFLGELSHEEAMAIIDQIAQCGIFRVDLTGGEPFVRPDFWELVDALQTHDILVGKIYTNGWLLNGEVLDQFEARGLKPAFSLSFDGVGWHDWMRGVRGAEEAALNALRLCVKRGFLVDVEMCLHKGNVHTLRDTVRLLAGIGVPTIKVAPVVDTELWRKNGEANDYSVRECYEDNIAYIPQYFEDGCPMRVILPLIDLVPRAPWYRMLGTRYSENMMPEKCHLCGSVRANAYIAPDGRLLPCMPMTSAPQEFQEQFPKVTEIGLQKGLSNSFFMEFVDRRVSDLIRVNEKCAACPHVRKCGGGCRAAALQYTGDLMGADEDLCMLFNEGWEDRARQTAEEAIARYCPKENQNGSTAG